MRQRKRIFILAITVITLLIGGFSPSFAAGLKLVDTYPEDGFSSALTMNMIVRLQFDQPIIDIEKDEVEKYYGERSFIQLRDEEGNLVEEVLIICENDDDEELYRLNILPEGELQGNTEYTLTLSKDIQLAANSENTLDNDITVTFKTRDPSADNKISMALMAVMMALMIGVTVFTTNRQMKKQATEEEEKVNPYKVAKEKGVPVEKVLEEMKKAEAKKAKAKSSKSAPTAKEKAQPEKKKPSRTGLKKVRGTYSGKTYKGPSSLNKQKEEPPKKNNTGNRPSGNKKGGSGNKNKKKK